VCKVTQEGGTDQAAMAGDVDAGFKIQDSSLKVRNSSAAISKPGIAG
jgi:hypothetical protein